MKPVNKIVLLGASNLTMSLRLIIQLLQQQCGGPSEVLVAAGHGRSYGENSQVLVRELPGIVRSGLWRQLHTHESHLLSQPSSQPLYAFLTDIGNDIPYGFSPEQILYWVSWCIEQLQKQSAYIIMTNLPIASIESLSERRFTLLRNVLFPTCGLSHKEVIARARALHQGLTDLAIHHSLILHEPASEWMSFDGIHVSFWKRQAFYRQLFENSRLSSCFSENHRELFHAEDKKASFLAWQRRPQFAVRRIFRKIQCVPQPSGHFADLTTVALY